jgi:hypothetical protein
VRDCVSDEYAAIRGREQIIYEDCLEKGHRLLNKIMPISAKNKRLAEYMERGARLKPPK